MTKKTNGHASADSPVPTREFDNAVVYLRVSTREQAEMGGEAEGFSIPAQRAACMRKAESLGASIVEEFADRGESAKTANRPELARMLKYLQEHPVTYVIVHKVDRLARNRADDVVINMEIKRSGATLISCSENIDETPSGMLLHGIMSSIAEFYSRNLASEVIKGMDQKARSGGTVGKAPVGYLHVRTNDSGNEVRTIAIDPERGPLIQWAFRAYATGDWTLRQLLEELTERGLTGRPGRRTAAKPISVGTLATILANPYYIGQVVFRGVHYQGKHEPLVDSELFERVQYVLEAHNYAGEKQFTHNHYLKGSVFCGTCGSRLGISYSRSGTGDIYDYFYCLGRQRNKKSCSMRAIRVSRVERLIERHYIEIQLPPERIIETRLTLGEALAIRRRESGAEEEVQKLRIARLTDERRKLLHLHYADAVPMDLFAQEQRRITRDLENAQRQLDEVTLAFDVVQNHMERALELAEDCHAAYVDADDSVRRLFNQAFFDKLIVHEDGAVTHELAEPFRLLLDPTLPKQLADELRSTPECCDNEPLEGSHNEKDPAQGRAQSSNVAVLVGPAGLEPATGRL